MTVANYKLTIALTKGDLNIFIIWPIYSEIACQRKRNGWPALSEILGQFKRNLHPSGE